MKNKHLLLIVMIVVVTMLAGCEFGKGTSTATSVANTKAGGTPVPDGEITVPAVDLRINTPATSIQIQLPGPNPLINQPDAQGRLANVLLGIWHGVASPVTLVISFINPEIQMYEVHNDGSPYNLGFLLGVGLVFILIGAFAGSKRR